MDGANPFLTTVKFYLKFHFSHITKMLNSLCYKTIWSLLPKILATSTLKSKLLTTSIKSLSREVSCVSSNKWLCFSLMGFTLYNTNDKQQEKSSNLSEEHVPNINSINTKTTEALLELMHTINFCIIEISQQYKDCLERQISITNSKDLTDENWDDLIKCRVEAEELKLEFDKYKLIIHKVEQFVFSHAVKNLLNGNESIIDDLNHEYNTLLNFLRNLERENKELESKLLKAKQKSIIQGLQEEVL